MNFCPSSKGFGIVINVIYFIYVIKNAYSRPVPGAWLGLSPRPPARAAIATYGKKALRLMIEYEL
eukprot:scaffold254048_cov17-Prasinocladus_malaysianus.AAC.1